MKVKLTKNLDKDRCFVNGTLATIVQMLDKCTFVAVTSDSERILVHAVAGSSFQLCTLRDDDPPHGGRRVTDRGYGYVGASRVRHRNDLLDGAGSPN